MTRFFKTNPQQSNNSSDTTDQLHQFQSMRASTSYALGMFCCNRLPKKESVSEISDNTMTLKIRS